MTIYLGQRWQADRRARLSHIATADGEVDLALVAARRVAIEHDIARRVAALLTLYRDTPTDELVELAAGGESLLAVDGTAP